MNTSENLNQGQYLGHYNQIIRQFLQDEDYDKAVQDLDRINERVPHTAKWVKTHESIRKAYSEAVFSGHQFKSYYSSSCW
jgi:proline dehydrogenase